MSFIAKDGITKMVRDTRVVTTTLAALSLFVRSPELLAGIEAKSYQTHSHISIKVDPSAEYSVEKLTDSKGRLTGLKLVLGNVKEELDELRQFTDARTQRTNVSFSRASDGTQKTVYEFMFSPKAVASGIEYFDYRNKAPSEIALDYWLKSQKPSDVAGESASAKESRKQGRQPTSQFTKAVAPKSGKKPQAPVFAGCGTPLVLSDEAFVHYKVDHRPYKYKSFFKLESADTFYEYPFLKPVKGEKLGERAKEIAHYRLAHKLFSEGKLALTLRTIDFFGGQYRSSKLVPELEFLRASTLLKLSKLLKTPRYYEQALEMYRKVILENLESERGQASLAFIVQELMDKGDRVAALQYALIGAEQKATNEKDLSRFVYRLASAESLYSLGEMDRAERAYQYLIEQNNEVSIEAAFRSGEIFSTRKFFERAAIAYEKAIRQYPKHAPKYPAAYLNLGEAYFRMGKLEDSKRVFADFDRFFPNDVATWAANFRIVEIAQIQLKETSGAQSASIQKQYESIVNRFPYSPGAVFAELRLAKCFQSLKHSDQTYAFYDKFFAERNLSQTKSSLIDDAQVDLWNDLAEARFFVENGDARRALGRADQYRNAFEKFALGKEFKKAYAKAVSTLFTQVDESSAKDLLALSEKFGDLAPKPETISFLLAMAKAKAAVEDAEGVNKLLATVESRIGEATDEEKDNFHFLKSRQLHAAAESPDKIIVELSQMRDEGVFAAIKLDELTKLSLQKNDVRAAIAYDGKLLSTGLVNQFPIERRFAIYVRRLDNISRSGNSIDAERFSEEVLFKFGAQTQFRDLQARIREVRASALYDTGKFKAAVEAIDEVLTISPEHPRRTEFEFMRGKAFAKLGRENEALETFRRLAQAPKNDVWKRSAQAELDQLQWESSVSTQIQEKDRRSLE